MLKKVKVIEKDFFFPSEGITVKAKNIIEATKEVKKIILNAKKDVEPKEDIS